MGWLLFLGPLFFLLYGICNWLTSLRSDVPTAYFEWERAIPFVSAMIIPYLSTDFFFAGSFFLCRDSRELQTLGLRFLSAILLSAAGFLLFPLRFAFERPEIDGIYGALFHLLGSFDEPYNQAPSLHLSLLVLQWMVYARHTHGVLRTGLYVWSVLIGLSTVLTYQHHVLDLCTGVAVAIASYYLFLERAVATSGVGTCTSVPVRRHWRLAGAYATGAALCAAAAVLDWHITHPFLWPAAALGLVASAYAGLGTAMFLKSSGRLSLAGRLVLVPYLLGAYVSFRLYTHGQAPYVEVAPGLLLGRKLLASEARQAVAEGVVAVVDLTAEFSEAASLRSLPYLNLQVLDLTVPSLSQLRAAADFIHHHRLFGRVLVHCALGYGRSPDVVAAYLLASGEARTVAESVTRVRHAQPRAVFTPAALTMLEAFSRERTSDGACRGRA